MSKKHPLVNLVEIKQAGGPSVRTMRWRISNGHYPEAQLIKRGWKLPKEILERVIGEESDCREMIPLAEAAIQCGLKSTSLNSQANRGIIHGKKLYNRWFVARTELERLKRYYCDTVTSSEAAKILGFSHRVYLHKFSRDRLPYERLGSERRFHREALQRFLDQRTVSK